MKEKRGWKGRMLSFIVCRLTERTVQEVTQSWHPRGRGWRSLEYLKKLNEEDTEGLYRTRYQEINDQRGKQNDPTPSTIRRNQFRFNYFCRHFYSLSSHFCVSMLLETKLSFYREWINNSHDHHSGSLNLKYFVWIFMNLNWYEFAKCTISSS